jgi:Cu+-exporting ATPase
MEKISWKVDGMHCANCALSINKYLQKQGATNVSVNAINGGVSFEVAQKEPAQLAKGLESMGYKIAVENGVAAIAKKPFLSTHGQRFLFCLPFTAVLMLHMIPSLHIHFLMNPWIQLALTLPVFIVGMSFFGRSAIKSLRNGVPNMNVLISVGALSAFVYSLTGAILGLGEDYLFFETTATIITLVFLGEYLEHASIESTQRSLKALAKSEKVMANMIAFDDQHQEVIFPVENTQLKVGDLVQINTGEQVPADAKILWGEAQMNEALLTGESIPLFKKGKDLIIGGSIVESGTLKAQVTAVGSDTVLSRIINLVKQAQGEKPPVQQMADRISAIFVPVVIAIALVTLTANWIILGEFTPALLRSIAVLVIACPCAMGLATPAAIAVGLGRGARNGILFRDAKSLELFKDAKQVVFDKTGTLTTGKFTVSGWQLTVGSIVEEEFKRIVYSLEKYSAHPLAKSITAAWKTGDEMRWKKIDEIKGLGLEATDMQGNKYTIGSYKNAEAFTKDDSHNIYVVKNNELLGWIDLQDELRPEAKSVVQYLQGKGIKTILLSGDRYGKTKAIGDALGIEEVIAEQTPEQKLQKVAGPFSTRDNCDGWRWYQ